MNYSFKFKKKSFKFFYIKKFKINYFDKFLCIYKNKINLLFLYKYFKSINYMKNNKTYNFKNLFIFSNLSIWRIKFKNNSLFNFKIKEIIEYNFSKVNIILSNVNLYNINMVFFFYSEIDNYLFLHYDNLLFNNFNYFILDYIYIYHYYNIFCNLIINPIVFKNL
uniref:Uncharacterized protein n=1 Tax=Ichthyophthirius multifiliis TaxID=5932 RepID=G1FLB5_ICHMU|nr:hypothetical protein IMG5_M206952 [Ichthyophthirius multifiliis]AEL89257.1 hypothetical protein IMG5_M206952 [Ichthyophthirius multifiliis]